MDPATDLSSNRLVRSLLETVRVGLAFLRKLRFRVWVLGLRLKLRVHGCRLIIDAPHGVMVQGRPDVRIFPQGDGTGTVTLRFGKGVWIGRGLALDIDPRGENVLEVGDDSLIMRNVRLILKTGTIALGARCDLRDGVWLKSSGNLVLGSDIPIGQNSAVHCASEIRFADYVGIAERVAVLDSDHGFDGGSTHFLNRELQVEATTIDRNTFIAAGAVVLRGSRIGANSFVGANSVVRGGVYADGSLIAGIPGRVISSPAETPPTLASAASS
jgi:acetyltransferase-like isoleucine patch superfamily enzyme